MMLQENVTYEEAYGGNLSSAVYSDGGGDDVGDNNRTNWTSTQEPTLPIDMQFNDGHRLAIIVYSVLMVFSAIGNLSVLATIQRWRKRQGRLTRVNLLLSHLAIADLLVTFLMMPMEIGWNATVTWQAGDIFCRIFSFTRTFGLYLSGFILMCISLDRYYAVVHPLSITQSGWRCRKMLALAWLSSGLCSAPQAVIFHVESHPIFTWYLQCVTFNSFPSSSHEQAYNFFGFMILYGLPLVTITSCYLRILWEIWMINSQRRSEEEQLRRSSMETFGRAKTRTLKMTLALISIFFTCWTPYQSMCLWYWVDKQSAAKVDQRIQKGLFLFACTNSCVNPLIYGLFHFKRRNQTNATATMASAVVGDMATSSSLQTRQQRIELESSAVGCGTISMAVSSF